MTRPLLLLFLLLLPAPALAQCHRNACPTHRRTVARPAMATAQAQTQAMPVPTALGDPQGFTGWLNATRAQYGLAPVGYDPNLQAWAAQNNAAQNARGLGHHVLPGCRQNAAMAPDLATACRSWMGSPPHRALLLAPGLRVVGLAGAGQWWTLNGL